MTSSNTRLQIDDDPVFDDTDLYDNDDGPELKVEAAENMKRESEPKPSLTGASIKDRTSDAQDADMNILNSTDISSSTATQAEKSDAKPVEAKSAEIHHAEAPQSSAQGIQSATMKTKDVNMGDAGVTEQQSNGLPNVTALTEARPAEAMREGAALNDREMIDREFVEVARANRGDPEAEFEEDSDPEMSDDSSESDSDDSSSDDDSDYGSIILDPAEAARMLMRASPEEGGASAGPPRTVNEQQEKPFDFPNITNINEVLIVELGEVSHIIERNNCVVVKAKVHANHNVLQPGSALCLADRTIIRPISDTIAQVQEPYYVSYFESLDEISKFGIREGTRVYYPDDPLCRSFVFYEELRKQKYTDASNIYDEEVNDNEMEFSDDEQEAAYKKSKKEEKQRKFTDRQQGKPAGAGQFGDEAAPRNRNQQRGGHRGRGGQGSRGGLPRTDANNRRPESRSSWQDYDADGRPESSHGPSSANQPSSGLDYGDDDDGYVKPKRPDDYGTWENTPKPDFQPQARGEYGNQRGGRGGQGFQRGDRGGYNNRRGNRGNRFDQPTNRGRSGPFESTPLNQMPKPDSLPRNPVPPSQQTMTWPNPPPNQLAAPLPPPPSSQWLPTNPNQWPPGQWQQPQASGSPTGGPYNNNMYQQPNPGAQNGAYSNGYGNQHGQGTNGMPWFGNGNAQNGMNWPGNSNSQNGMNWPANGNAQNGAGMPQFGNNNTQFGFGGMQFGGYPPFQGGNNNGGYQSGNQGGNNNNGQ